MTLLAPAYALGALDPDDRREFEEHLSTCAACAAEVQSMSRITAGLGQTVTLVSPRPELRNRVLSAVGASTAGSGILAGVGTLCTGTPGAAGSCAVIGAFGCACGWVVG